METNFTSIKERILYITNFKQIGKEKFFNDLGVTYGNFKGKAKEKALSSDVLAKIVSIYPDINPEWLLTGKGNMLKSMEGLHYVNEPEEKYSVDYKRLYLRECEIVDVLKKQIIELEEKLSIKRNAG